MSAAARVFALVLGVSALGPAAARAQQVPPAQAIEQARIQLDELRPDSALSLLRYALDPRAGAGVRERLRGFTLLGIAELVGGRRAEARQAFRQALALDPELRIDSLADLHSDLRPTFEAERASLARATQLAIVLEIPSDTSVQVLGGGFRVTALPSRRAMLLLSIARPTGEEVFADSQAANGITSFDWNLRGAGGAVAPAGRYVLRVLARDSVGQSSFQERTLTIELEPLDTVPLPPALDPSRLAPETTAVRQRKPAPLLRGLLFAAGAGLLAYTGPGPSGSLDSRAWAVSAALAAVGVAGYLSGTMVRLPNPAGVERNRSVREQDAAQRTAITESNDRARERARVHIRTTTRTP